MYVLRSPNHILRRTYVVNHRRHEGKHMILTERDNPNNHHELSVFFTKIVNG